ncbi:MAG: hypothetical protein ACE5GE_17260, partial [Phycisphaerae bacterium]
MYEVHSIQQQGRPYGAVVASAILLVGCLGLAAGLVASRGLGGEIRPEGWGIAFRPPTKWEQAQLETDTPRTSLYFHRPGPADQKRELYFVRRANPRRLRANQICGFEASRFFGIAGRLEVAFARQSIQTADFGPLPGANLILPGGYLHVGVMQRQGRPAEAYVMVYTSPVPMDQSDVALIGALIRSVR